MRVGRYDVARGMPPDAAERYKKVTLLETRNTALITQLRATWNPKTREWGGGLQSNQSLKSMPLVEM